MGNPSESKVFTDVLSDSKNVPPIACEKKHATTSSPASLFHVHSKNLTTEKKGKSVESTSGEGTSVESTSGEGTSVEDDIERSKVHWSQLTEYTNDNEEVAEASNVEVFKSLQGHPTWGRYFFTFGDGGIYDVGELVIGEKFAEGGQAELYHAFVTWKNPKYNFEDENLGYRYVLKVFRKGTFLQDLQRQWPEGMFRYFEDAFHREKLGEPAPTKYTCNIHCGTLLRNGRFAFLLLRETGDLRTLIDRNVKAKTNLSSTPFPLKMTFKIMYYVARGMDRLHNLNIVHRDLKASNVLYAHLNTNCDEKEYFFYVADYECSIGVVGTGFFRAPEILQAIKDKVVNNKPNLFTKASNVYSYGMMCYEILTGKLPFEGHRMYDFDHVLKGQQLEVPHHVDEWIRDLLQSCWQKDPSTRPTFGEILDILEVKAEVCGVVPQHLEKEENLTSEEQKELVYKYEFES